MKALSMVGWILVMVGALNWGLVGLGALVSGADWNVVHMIVGSWPVVEAIVYVLVGLAAVWQLVAGRRSSAPSMAM